MTLVTAHISAFLAATQGAEATPASLGSLSWTRCHNSLLFFAIGFLFVSPSCGGFHVGLTIIRLIRIKCGVLVSCLYSIRHSRFSLGIHNNTCNLSHFRYLWPFVTASCTDRHNKLIACFKARPPVCELRRVPD